MNASRKKIGVTQPVFPDVVVRFAARFDIVQATATRVNIARGGIVDDAALADVLASGRLAAAGLDVYENEPNLHPALPACRNIVLTPHIASASVSTRRAMVAPAVDNLIAALETGTPPNLINPDALRTRAVGSSNGMHPHT